MSKRTTIIPRSRDRFMAMHGIRPTITLSFAAYERLMSRRNR